MNIPPITMPTGQIIGSGYPAYIIAEIGSNHDGDLDRAKMLIAEAKKAGADAAKFQSFQAASLINPTYKNKESWEQDPAWDTLKKLSISAEWHHELSKTAKSLGIDFLSTPFDLERLQLLLEIDVPAIKIASGDLTYHTLISEAGKSGKPIFLSTGHALLGEVEAALKILWEAGSKNIVLLHCTSLYPADFPDANISAMVSMQQGFRVQVGYSDHTPGAIVPLGAVALGACVIEKHFTDDKTRQGADHSFALNCTEFADMVSQIRKLESALKISPKTYRNAEKNERVMARRALYAKENISRGQNLSLENIKMVRHAYSEGISADLWETAIGKPARFDIKKDELITRDMI